MRKHRELIIWAISVISGLVVAWIFKLYEDTGRAFAFAVLWGLASVTIAYLINRYSQEV